MDITSTNFFVKTEKYEIQPSPLLYPADAHLEAPRVAKEAHGVDLCQICHFNKPEDLQKSTKQVSELTAPFLMIDENLGKEFEGDCLFEYDSLTPDEKSIKEEMERFNNDFTFFKPSESDSIEGHNELEETSSGKGTKKSDKKASKGKYDTRKDVLYKNIFRAVKKYFTNLFKNTSSIFEIKGLKPRRKVIKKYLETFIRDQLFTQENSENLKKEKVEDLCEYFGRICAPKMMPKSFPDYLCKKSMDAFFECVYNYNARNAQKLYESSIMFSIFKFFLLSDDFYTMLEEDENLSKNQELCKEKALEILDGFNAAQK